MRTLPTIIDIALIKLAILIEKIRLKRSKDYFEIGKVIYDREFEEEKRKIKILGQDLVKDGKFRLDPIDIKKPIISDTLHDIFKKFCMKHHPDVSEEDPSYFKNLKELYDNKNYLDFLYNCNIIESSETLIEEYTHLSKETKMIKNTTNYELGFKLKNDKVGYYQYLSKVYDNIRSTLSNYKHLKTMDNNPKGEPRKK